MVGHLVVTDKGSVSRGDAGEDVADEGVNMQLAQNSGRHASNQGVFEVAMMLVQAGLDVFTPLLPEAVALQYDVPEEEQQGAGELL